MIKCWVVLLEQREAGGHMGWYRGVGLSGGGVGWGCSPRDLWPLRPSWPITRVIRLAQHPPPPQPAAHPSVLLAAPQYNHIHLLSHPYSQIMTIGPVKNGFGSLNWIWTKQFVGSPPPLLPPPPVDRGGANVWRLVGIRVRLVSSDWWSPTTHHYHHQSSLITEDFSGRS